MAENVFDHDKLDVYRLSIEYVADSFRIVSMLTKLVQRGESMAEFSPPRDAEVEYEHDYEHVSECEGTA